MRLRMVLALLTLVIVAATPTFAAAQDDDDIDGAFVHGIPDTPVDVYVDGLVAFDDVAPLTVEGPVFLQAGTYEVELRAADASALSTPLVSAAIRVPSGTSAVRIVAVLGDNGEPVLELVFPDISAVSPGKGRVVVHHLADLPAVDVLGNGQPLQSGLLPGNQFEGVVSPTSFGLNVRVANSTAALLDEDVAASVAADRVAEYFLVGSGVGDTLAVVEYTSAVNPNASNDLVRPNNVPTGTAGLAQAVGSNTSTLLLVMALAGLGVVFGGYRAVRAGS